MSRDTWNIQVFEKWKASTTEVIQYICTYVSENDKNVFSTLQIEHRFDYHNIPLEDFSVLFFSKIYVVLYSYRREIFILTIERMITIIWITAGLGFEKLLKLMKWSLPIEFIKETASSKVNGFLEQECTRHIVEIIFQIHELPKLKFHIYGFISHNRFHVNRLGALRNFVLKT